MWQTDSALDLVCIRAKGTLCYASRFFRSRRDMVLENLALRSSLSLCPRHPPQAWIGIASRIIMAFVELRTFNCSLVTKSRKWSFAQPIYGNLMKTQSSKICAARANHPGFRSAWNEKSLQTSGGLFTQCRVNEYIVLPVASRRVTEPASSSETIRCDESSHAKPEGPLNDLGGVRGWGATLGSPTLRPMTCLRALSATIN